MKQLEYGTAQSTLYPRSQSGSVGGREHQCNHKGNITNRFWGPWINHGLKVYLTTVNPKLHSKLSSHFKFSMGPLLQKVIGSKLKMFVFSPGFWQQIWAEQRAIKLNWSSPPYFKILAQCEYYLLVQNFLISWLEEKQSYYLKRGTHVLNRKQHNTLNRHWFCKQYCLHIFKQSINQPHFYHENKLVMYMTLNNTCWMG